MARWVETSWYRWTFKEDTSTRHSENRKYVDGIWDKNYFKISNETVEEALADLSKYCNEQQYEIKSLMAIDRAETETSSRTLAHSDTRMVLNAGWGYGYGWGFGHGWGITMTSGFVAMLQRIEDISQEEFDNRWTVRKKENEVLRLFNEQKESIASSIEQTKTQLSSLNNALVESKKNGASSQEYTLAGIETSKGLFGTKYNIKDKSFKHQEEAISFMAECRASIKTNQEKIEELNADIIIETQKLATLEDDFKNLR